MVQLHTQPDQQQVQCQTYRKPSPNIIKTQVHRVCEVPAPTAASEKELVPSEIVARLEPQIIESLRDGQIAGKKMTLVMQSKMILNANKAPVLIKW